MASAKTLSLKEIKDITDSLPKNYRLEAYRTLKNAKFANATKASDLKLLKLKTQHHQIVWFLYKPQKVQTSSFHTNQLS